MTLVLTVQGGDTIWVVADRRLSYRGGRPPTDDAVKIMELATTDGVGLLAYAGLGSTSQGMEPSALRGRGGLTFEAALGVLSNVATRELPRHLVDIGANARFIVVPAFIQGHGARLYSIDTVIDSRTRRQWSLH